MVSGSSAAVAGESAADASRLGFVQLVTNVSRSVNSKGQSRRALET